MKRILVPTDFSPIADNALKYAIGIAAKFQSELFLCHVFSFDRFNYDLDVPENKQPYAREMERKIKRARQKFSGKIEEEGLTVHTVVEQDSIFSLFGRKVNELRIDMIVMGSKGASGIEKVVFGTVAGTALNWAKVPVLVVPPLYAFQPLADIVLAIDDKEVSREVLSPFLKIAFDFGAKVTVLNAKSDRDKKVFKKIDHHLEGVETTYREVPMLSSVNESINDFVEKEGCDLLCMVRREKGFFESIFKKSITKVQVFNSKVPLLVLPDQY